MIDYNRDKVSDFLDVTIPKIIRLEEEVGIMEFINECIKIYYDRGNGGWEYDMAKEEFLDKVFN